MVGFVLELDRPEYLSLEANEKGRHLHNWKAAYCREEIKAVYTDGSAELGSDAGYGVVCLLANGQTVEIGGFERKSTNQRAELLAAISALDFISNRRELAQIQVFSDSEYVCKGYGEWVESWKANNWKTSEGKDVSNRDLWEKLDSLRCVSQIDHMRGHSDRSGKDGSKRRSENYARYGDLADQHNRGNIRADQIAGYCRKNLRSFLNQGGYLSDSWLPPVGTVETAPQKQRKAPTSKPKIFGGNGQKIELDQTLEEWALSDWKSSGISDEMILLNMRTIDGDEAIEVLSAHAIAQSQNVRSYATKEAQKILKRYEFAGRGAWVSYGTTIDGGTSEVAYVKPRFPRIDFEKRKPIKYETPGKCEALPILPFVSEAVAQKTYAKYGVVPLEGESYWSVVKRCNLPISITEGDKKAVLQTQEGYPTISLRGVCNWHSKGEKALFPILQEFATEGREIRIVFDQDTKPKTIRNVGQQIKQLGAVLEQCGCKVSVATWDSASGKGIDDAFVKMGAEWLGQTIAASLSFEEWKKAGLNRQYLELIRRLKTLTIVPDRDTTGDYLPELPSDTPIGSITLIQANMNSGKSFTGINRTVRNWIENGGNVLRIDPILSLGAQGSQLSNIPHSSDYDLGSPDGYSAFCRDISARHGAAVCFNSLHRIPQWFLTDRPLLLVLDEVNQGLDYLIKGDTLGSKHGEILDKFAETCLLCGVSGAIISAEAEIHPRSVELLKNYAGSDNIRYFKHYRQNSTWDVTLGSGRLSGFMQPILDPAFARKLIMTDSQASGKRIERRLRPVFPDKKIVRIDSETNRGGTFADFFENPDAWLEQNQPDVLICSPSLKTGVSIQWQGFDAVYGYFVGTDPDSWMQMLGRYRPAVPRFVCCPDFVVTQGDESLYSPTDIREFAAKERQLFSNAYPVEALEAEDPRKAHIRLAASEYYAEMCALRGAQKAISREYLISALTDAGHTITVNNWDKNGEEQVVLTEIQETIDHEDATAFANSPTCATVEEARKKLASECSLSDEVMARKTIARHEFPGISFDDEKDCYWLLTRNRRGVGSIGNLGYGVQVQAGIENIDAIQELEREQAEKILSDELGLSHRLPRRWIRFQLLKLSGILSIAHREVEFSNTDPRCIAIQQFAVKYSKQFRYYFGLTIEAEYRDSKGNTRHSPVDVCNKLLKKLGFKAKSIKKKGGRGQQQLIYTIEIDRVSAPPMPGAKKEDIEKAKATLQDEAWSFRDKALAAARERLNLIKPIKPATPESQPEAEVKQSKASLPQRVAIPSLDDCEMLEAPEGDDGDEEMAV